MKSGELRKRYPWLKKTTSIEEYIEPDYYDYLLRDYIFEGKSDLNHFRNFLSFFLRHNKKKVVNILDIRTIFQNLVNMGRTGVDLTADPNPNLIGH